MRFVTAACISNRELKETIDMVADTIGALMLYLK